MPGKFTSCLDQSWSAATNPPQCRQSINELWLVTVHVGLKLVEGTGSFCVCEVTIDSGQVCRHLWKAFKAEMGCKQLAASGQVYRHADGVPAWGEARSSSPCRENPRKMMARTVQLFPGFQGLCIPSTSLGH